MRNEVVGGFGVQYTPHQRFGIFGEVGISCSESTFGLSELKSETIATRTAAGIVFYF